jgi:hypothetical protein
MLSPSKVTMEKNETNKMPDALDSFASNKFDIKAIEDYAHSDVANRFRQSLIDGTKTTEDDMEAIESALFQWCSQHDCIHYAHW